MSAESLPNGSFFISKPETEMDEALSMAPLVALHPEVYRPRLDAIAELRKLDDGSLHKGSAFRLVASFINIPLFNVANTVLDPEFMKDKKKFYSWLRRNKEYCTYDIRSHTVAPQGTVTYVDGKAI